MAKKLTKAKAREILHDKEVHGHPLTDKQRRFFGAIASAQNGIEGTMGGLTDKGFNLNPAWGGAWKNGGWLDKYQDGGTLQPPMAGANQTVPMAQNGIIYREIGLIPPQKEKSRQPIYTDDVQKLQDYSDSLHMYNTTRSFINAINKLNITNPSNKWTSSNAPKEKIDKIADLQANNLKFRKTNPLYSPDGKIVGRSNPSSISSNLDYMEPIGTKTLSTVGEYYSVQPWRVDIYQKPVQPVIYKKRTLERPTLEPLDIPNIELTSTRPAITQPTFEQAKVDMSTPTKYSFTYPTFDKDVQKTMYFPDRSSWKTFVEQRAVSSQEGKDYGSATGQFAMGGSIPGSTGMMYARTAGAAPSEGPYAKKTLPSAQPGITQPPSLEGAADWYKTWYSQRKALPQFEALAQQRLEGIEGGIPQLVLKPMEELKKNRAIAEFEKARSVNPQDDRIYASDPATVGDYQKKLEQERGKPLIYPIDPEVGVSTPVLSHELSHWFDARFPQSMFSKQGSEKYPTDYYFVNPKKSDIAKDDYSWITSRMMSKATPLKTELNAVLNNLRQAEGLRGDQPTTPEQMQKIIEKYKNLPKEKLAEQTKEGSINSVIRLLIDSIGGDPEKLSEMNNRIVAAQREGTPTAQNGAEMSFYQQGLDWTPKNISRNGGWLDKYSDEVPQAQAGFLTQRYSTGPMMGDLATQTGTAEELRKAEIAAQRPALEAKLKKEREQAAAVARYKAMPKIGTAEDRNYSEQVAAEEQRRRLNQQYADQNPEVTVDDSGDIVPSGYGRFMQTYGPSVEKFGRSLETPLGAMSLATGVGSIASNTLRLGASALEKKIGRNLVSRGLKNFTGKVSPVINSMDDIAAYAQLDPVGIMGNRLNALSYNPTTALNTATNTITGVERNLTNSGIEAADLVLGENNTVKLFNKLDSENPKVQPGLDWMKKWYSDDNFINRSSSTGIFDPFVLQNYFLRQLDDYQPKTYVDLLKDKGLKEYLKRSPVTGGVSWGVPENIYVNRTMYAPFNKKGLESVRVHELTHLIENNGLLLNGLDEETLLKPFGISNIDEIPENPGFIKRELLRDKPKYYLNPTEIHARMNQARYDLGLSSKDKFTSEMFDKISKDKNWYGMGRYIKDKKSFIDLMNNFWGTIPAVGLTATAIDQKKDGGEIVKDNDGYWNPKNWGKPVEISSNKITMEGVLEPLLGVSDTGDTKMMYPGKNYTFSGTKVVEYPREHFRAEDGKSVNKADEYPLEKLDNLLNFTNYNKPKANSGKWLDKYK